MDAIPDYYERLELNRDDDRQKIVMELAKLNQEYRRRTNHRDASVRNEATEMIVLIGAAAAVFDSDEARAAYDQTLDAQKPEPFEVEEPEPQQPVPLLVGSTEVYAWEELEPALEQDPDLGSFLLQDGEIEAWVRWSLGEAERANWLRMISKKCAESDTPQLVFDEFLRLLNPRRPLIVYAPGQGTGTASAPVINHINDIPAMADAYWDLFVLRLETILDWMAQNTDGQALEKYQRLPPSNNLHIQMERLLFAIDPHLIPPMVTIRGGDFNQIDFGTVTGNQAPTITLEITQSGRGYLYGTITKSEPWIHIDQHEMEGSRTVVEVGLVPSQLVEGAHHIGTINLHLLDGRVPDIAIQVLARHHTTWQTVKNIFKKD